MTGGGRPKLKVKPLIRFMLKRDLPDVLDIERKSFEYPWTEKDFISALRTRNCIGMTAEYHEIVVSYMLYEIYKDHLIVVNLAVLPEACRKGIGRAMLNKLKVKLQPDRRSYMELHVKESNLSAQLFFASQGLVATDVIKSPYENTDEDAYVFRYLADWKPNT